MQQWKAVRLFALLLAFSITPAMLNAGTAKDSKKAPKAAAQQDAAPVLNFEKYKMKNGLEVILLEDRRLPMVAVNVWYHVGPANEKPGRTGFAHLFEHMMFQGSRYAGEKQHFKYLELAGASDINGTTNFDRTNYFETLPSNQLELALWLESDRMGFLLDTLDEAKFTNQIDVVRNERRQGENSPYYLVQEEMYKSLFPKGHPYHGVVIGSHQDLENAELKDVRDFFTQYYGPNNATLAIVGDINKAQAKALVEKYFGSIASGPPVAKPEAKLAPITQEIRKTVTDRVELPRLMMAWHSAPVFATGDAEADLLSHVLGGGKSSRLYKKLVYEMQIAQDVTAYQYSNRLASIFAIQATAKPGVTLEDIEKVIDAELERVRREGVTEAELQGARNATESGLIRGLETLGGFGGVADTLNRYNHYLGDPGYLAKDLDRYRKVNAAAVKQLAATTLASNKRVVVHGVPGEKVVNDVPRAPRTDAATAEKKEMADPEPWRKSPPKPGAASQLTLPVPKRFQLENGLTVMLVERSHLPVVSANLVVLTGSEANPQDRPGLASFAADMLDEGTKKRSTLQLADDLEQIGATLAANSSADSSTVVVRSLKRNADAAFEVLSDVVLNPAFEDKEITRIRNQRLTTIRQQRDNPGLLATKTFYGVVYGEKHPYGFIELGTAESNEAMTRDDLSKFWSMGYVPQNAALIIAGAMTEAEARATAEKYFGKWSGKKPQFKVPDATLASGRRLIVVDKPGSPQTQLRIGHVGVERSNPDYMPLQVMNTMLGGLFSSRINMNLREKHGYSYGAFSVFVYRRGKGPFFAGGGVRTDATAASIREVLNEIQTMRDTRLTADELALAKDSQARSLPGLFETTPQIAGTIGQIFVYDLPLDYYQHLPAKIDAVTVDEVERVAKKYLSPDSLVVVAVGDRAKIESDLKELKIGTLEFRDFDGKLVQPEKAAEAAKAGQ